MFVKWVVWAPATACIGSVFSMGRNTGEFWPLPNPPSDPNLCSGRTRDDRGIRMPCSTSSVFFLYANRKPNSDLFPLLSLVKGASIVYRPCLLPPWTV
ncbi:hypothetical protein CABS01_04197 [Colletotrichum abscissum]|uniref:uncharacterized protein n=1 Tax=Colletotrichum abscissum TaxID=1671311 RepID=UPI0027D5E49E|nr:uncharacterized protein CABS01_04197 [Colletotrichum abscissum]KAK1473535.1 hypothetical protein CABS01_04197 [Colletotrichum abscissum]